jgi:hypothetical protein
LCPAELAREVVLKLQIANAHTAVSCSKNHLFPISRQLKRYA